MDFKLTTDCQRNSLKLQSNKLIKRHTIKKKVSFNFLQLFFLVDQQKKEQEEKNQSNKVFLLLINVFWLIEGP